MGEVGSLTGPISIPSYLIQKLADIAGPREFPPVFLNFSAQHTGAQPAWRQGQTQLTGVISWGLLQRPSHQQPGRRNNKIDLGNSRDLLYSPLYLGSTSKLAIQQFAWSILSNLTIKKRQSFGQISQNKSDSRQPSFQNCELFQTRMSNEGN